ncbi:MAG: hypothetical protein RLO46_04930 [Pseudomonadales bacterium]
MKTSSLHLAGALMVCATCYTDIATAQQSNSVLLNPAITEHAEARRPVSKPVRVSPQLIEQGERAQAQRNRGPVASTSDDVLERGTRAQQARGKAATSQIQASDDVLERGTRAQQARRNVRSSSLQASDDVLLASDDALQGSAKSGSRAGASSALKGAAGGAAVGVALYGGVEIVSQEIEDPGKTMRDIKEGNINVDAEELGLAAATGAAGAGGGAVYGGYKLIKQEVKDPGKTVRDIRNGDINLTATDAVMIGGAYGLAAYGTYKFVEQEVNDPGKTRDDAYGFLDEKLGVELTEEERRNIDRGLSVVNPAYGAYTLYVNERQDPGSTRREVEATGGVLGHGAAAAGRAMSSAAEDTFSNPLRVHGGQRVSIAPSGRVAKDALASGGRQLDAASRASKRLGTAFGSSARDAGGSIASGAGHAGHQAIGLAVQGRAAAGQIGHGVEKTAEGALAAGAKAAEKTGKRIEKGAAEAKQGIADALGF